MASGLGACATGVLDDTAGTIAGGTGTSTSTGTGTGTNGDGGGATAGGNANGSSATAGNGGGTATAGNGGTSTATAGNDGGSDGGSGGTATAGNGGGTATGGSDGGSGGTATTGNNGGNNNNGGSNGGGATKPTQGEILITEVMFNPSTTEPNTEWFEVYNAASGARDLDGLVISDGSGNSHTIATSVVIQPGAYGVLIDALGQGSPTVPSGSIVYAYSALTFANSNTASNVKIADSGTTIAQAPYGGFPSTLKASGASLQLQALTFADESQSGSWCKSTLTWSGSADMGTPGAAAHCQ